MSFIRICVRQPDVHSVRMVSAKKGSKILSLEGKIVGIVDDIPVELNGELALRTVHKYDCLIICHNKKGSPCKLCRATLHSMYHRLSKQCSDSSSELSRFSNERYM